MTQEDKKIISNLSVNEGLMTGYPHIDKPWMKYYDSSKADMELPKATLYEQVSNQASNYPNTTIITYNGKKINYSEFLDNINNCAKILTAFGVKKGDRVLYLMPNIPEAAYFLYAGNMLGAVADYIDPRPDSIDLKISAGKVLEIVKKEKISKIVSFDQCFLPLVRPVDDELKDLGINDVLVVRATDSMTTKNMVYYLNEQIRFNGFTKTIAKLKNSSQLNDMIDEAIKTSSLKVINYNDIKGNVNYERVNTIPFEENRLACITHSSGTSGVPKTIGLTNENVTSYPFQLSRSNVDFKVGDSCLHILPYFSAYGLGLANAGFTYGINMIQVPEFNPKDLGKMIIKYKPSIIMGTPNWYLSLQDDKALKNADLSFIKVIGFGGDSMLPEDELKANDFLASKKCPVNVTKGHGMSELSGGSSYATGEYNVPGSMGIPMVDTIYGIVDPVTKEPIHFDESDRISGEFIISSDALTMSEIDGRKLFDYGIYNGQKYIYTNDLGEMDKNGVLYFLSRDDRTFTRYDGFKVKPYVIEKEIMKVPGVKMCIVTSYEEPSRYGKMIQANVVLEKDSDLSKETDQKIVETIINEGIMNNPNLVSRQMPAKFKLWDEFPYTKNSKIDYKKVQEVGLDGTEIDVLFDETNIQMGEIKIVDPKSAPKKIKK